MEKMLVTQGLNELSLLDARIHKAIDSGCFVSPAKTNEKKVTPNKTKEDFTKEAHATYQSIMDLITRRDLIKKAIVASNAITEVTINGETMTVAAAIELKTSIAYKETLLQELKEQASDAAFEVNRKNIELEHKIDNFVSQNISGKDSKAKKEDYDELVKPIRFAGEYSLVDPLNIKKVIEELDNYIEGFKSEVDSVLQISNCTTWIEF